MIPCPSKTVRDFTTHPYPLNTRGNFIWVFFSSFFFFFSRMGLISVSGQKALCNRAIWSNVLVLSKVVSNGHRS